MTKEALNHLKAISEAFGPDAGIELDQKAWSKLHTAIKEALAQPEPVAFNPPQKWRDSEIADGYRGIRWVTADGVYGTPTQDDVVKYLGYTTPPQREWVGLESEQIRKAKHHIIDGAYHYSFKQGAEWAEAKLKELNT